MPEVQERAPRKRKRTTTKRVVGPITAVCRCGLSTPQPYSWYEFRFEDHARLYVSAEQFWQVGACPISAIDRLVRDFSLRIDNDVIRVPFSFGSRDTDPAQACNFLQSLMTLSVKDFALRSVCEGGSC
jgi:hypothetical protein